MSVVASTDVTPRAAIAREVTLPHVVELGLAEVGDERAQPGAMHELPREVGREIEVALHRLGPHVDEAELGQPVREAAGGVGDLDGVRGRSIAILGVGRSTGVGAVRLGDRSGQRRREQVGERIERAARPHRDRDASAGTRSIDQPPGSRLDVGEGGDAEHALHEIVIRGLPVGRFGDVQVELRHPLARALACQLDEWFGRFDRIDEAADPDELGRRQGGCPVARVRVEHALIEPRMRPQQRGRRDRVPEHLVESRERSRRVGGLLREIGYRRRVPHLPILALIWPKP